MAYVSHFLNIARGLPIYGFFKKKPRNVAQNQLKKKIKLVIGFYDSVIVLSRHLLTFSFVTFFSGLKVVVASVFSQ